METVTIILLLAGAAIVLANIVVSYRVAESDLLEPQQKIAQCAMIWLLPVLGAGLAYALMQEPRSRTGYRSDAFDNDTGDSFGIGSGGQFGGGDAGGGHDTH